MFEMNRAAIQFVAALALAASAVQTASAQEGPVTLSCEGTISLWEPNLQQFPQSGVLLTIDREITVQNLAVVSATWPVSRATDHMFFIYSDTENGGHVQGSVNRVSGDFTISAWTRPPVGNPGARAVMQFQGRCEPARRMF
jgi:hypothetical protein